jgi:hypothetical protein
MAPAAPTKEEILRLETAYWDAMKAKDGTKAAALSGDPSLVSGVQGVMSIPRSKMRELTESGDWELFSYVFEDVQFLSPTNDVAIIAYTVRQKVRMNGEDKDFMAADTSVWVREGEGWRCHAHSESMLNTP